MSQFENCPVCYTPMKSDYGYVDYGGPLCEEFHICSNGCYSYEFAYGSTNVYVTIRGHHLLFGWSWQSTDIRSESDAITVACKAAQQCLLEDLLKDKARLDWLEKDPHENMHAVDWRWSNWNDTVRSGIDFHIAHEDSAERSEEPSKPSLDNGLAL